MNRWILVHSGFIGSLILIYHDPSDLGSLINWSGSSQRNAPIENQTKMKPFWIWLWFQQYANMEIKYFYYIYRLLLIFFLFLLSSCRVVMSARSVVGLTCCHYITQPSLMLLLFWEFYSRHPVQEVQKIIENYAFHFEWKTAICHFMLVHNYYVISYQMLISGVRSLIMVLLCTLHQAIFAWKEPSAW